MTDPRRIAATVHDVIDNVTAAVEDVHKSVADFPLTVLGEITPFKDTLDEVKVTQDQTIEAGTGSSLINAKVRRPRQRTAVSAASAQPPPGAGDGSLRVEPEDRHGFSSRTRRRSSSGTPAKIVCRHSRLRGNDVTECGKSEPHMSRWAGRRSRIWSATGSRTIPK